MREQVLFAFQIEWEGKIFEISIYLQIRLLSADLINHKWTSFQSGKDVRALSVHSLSMQHTSGGSEPRQNDHKHIFLLKPLKFNIINIIISKL